MRTLLLGCLGALAALLLVAGSPVRGDEPKKDPTAFDDSLRNREPPFLVRAEVNKTTRDYREGDAISVRVATEEDAYVYVWYQQADGKAFQIFPNKYQSNNLVPARQAVDIPAKDDPYRWQIGPPFGVERIKVLASRTPLKSLSDPALVRDRFNVVSVKQVKGVELELGPVKAPEWTDCDLEIHTYSRDQAPQPAGNHRFGVFFGVSEYLFNAEYERAMRRRLNLDACNRDARTLAAVMREVGQLSNPVRIYTNGLATRRQMEQAITQWLPQVSRPGDTVVIFFAGHGMLLPPQVSGQPDGESLLAPHDAVTPDILKELLDRRQREGRPLDETSDAQLAEWLAVYRKAPEALLRHTFVSEGEFAHWLQRLDGRQIVVVLDCCNSGGFAKGDKGAAADSRDPSFTFLRGQVGRLRTLGQRDCAVLTACLKQQTSQTRQERDMGVMTHSLVDAIRESRGPLEIRQAHQECEARMKKYFEDRIPVEIDTVLNKLLKEKAPNATPEEREKIKAALLATEGAKLKEIAIKLVSAHQPVLYHSCTQPVYLKP
jgi:hypothetical protein